MFTFDTRELKEAIKGMKVFSFALPQIAAEEINKQVHEYAASGRNPDGSKWKNLSDKYAARKQKLVGNKLANKLLSGNFLLSVKNRGGVIAPDDAHIPQGQGLEKLRISFQVAQPTSDNIERLAVQLWNKKVLP